LFPFNAQDGTWKEALAVSHPGLQVSDGI